MVVKGEDKNQESKAHFGKLEILEEWLVAKSLLRY
jgi:hypothetical protein